MAGFEPKVVGFCCNWAAGSGVKQAEINEIQYFRNLCFLPLTHSGVIAGEVILEAVTGDVDEACVVTYPYCQGLPSSL